MSSECFRRCRGGKPIHMCNRTRRDVTKVRSDMWHPMCKNPPFFRQRILLGRHERLDNTSKFARDHATQISNLLSFHFSNYFLLSCETTDRVLVWNINMCNVRDKGRLWLRQSYQSLANKRIRKMGIKSILDSAENSDELAGCTFERAEHVLKLLFAPAM